MSSRPIRSAFSDFCERPYLDTHLCDLWVRTRASERSQVMVENRRWGRIDFILWCKWTCFTQPNASMEKQPSPNALRSHWLVPPLISDHHPSHLFALHDHTFTTSCRLIWILRFLDLANHHLKGFGDVLIVPCTGLGVCTIELLRQGLSFFYRDLTLIWSQITLVAHDHDRNPFRTLDESVSRVPWDQSAHWLTRWFKILSRMTWTISKDWVEATE